MSGALLSHFRASALGRALIMTFWYLLSGAAMTFIVAWSIAAIDPDLIRIESNYAVTSHEKPPDWDQYAFDDGRLFWMVATRRAPILTYHVWVAKFAYDPKEAQQSSEVPRLGYIRYVRTDEGRQQSWESVPIMPTSTPRPAPHHLERMFGVLGVRVGTRNIHAVTLTSIYGARVHGDNILLKYYGWPCHALGRAEQWRWNGLVLEWGAITPPASHRFASRISCIPALRSSTSASGP